MQAPVDQRGRQVLAWQPHAVKEEQQDDRGRRDDAHGARDRTLRGQEGGQHDREDQDRNEGVREDSAQEGGHARR